MSKRSKFVMIAIYNGLREPAPKILVQDVNRNIRPFWISVDAQPDFMTRTLKCETLNEPEKRSFLTHGVKQFNILNFNIPHLGNCNMSNLRHTVYLFQGEKHNCVVK